MHLHLILLSLILCIALRATPLQLQGNTLAWAVRWQQAMLRFLIPPLLLFVTAIAVLCMGHHGTMLGLSVGWLGCHLALAFLGWAIALLVWQFWRGWRSLQQLQAYSTQNIDNATVYLLESAIPYAAQVGFWQPRLVVSSGFLNDFTPEQVQAVLAHEQAHTHYRDTFWFFWLGWLRQLTAWLPNSQPLWDELLLLRELRADQWAAQRVDPLLLAETLLKMVKAPALPSQDWCAAFGTAAVSDRLDQRINALLQESTLPEAQPVIQIDLMGWLHLLMVFAPLLTLALHH